MVRCERLPGRIFLGDNFEATLGQLCGNLETTADGRSGVSVCVGGSFLETTLRLLWDNFAATWRQLPMVVWSGVSVQLGDNFGTT